MTAEEFQRLVNNCQPSELYNPDSSLYYPLGFANDLLPAVKLRVAEDVKVYDGAELFKGSRKTEPKQYKLTGSKQFISLYGFTYPKGVEAIKQRKNVIVSDNDVCVFIEVTQNDTIDVFLKLGRQFKEFLHAYSKQSKKPVSPTAVETSIFKTDIATFKKHFKNTLTHHNLMLFILKTIGMEEENQQETGESIIDQTKGTDILRVNEEGTALMQVKHEFVNVGESIAQVKYNTSATVTTRGTVIVSQFKQEISSRGEDVFYYKNSLGTFEGTLQDAANAFPDVDFSDIKIPPQNTQKKNPEFDNLGISWDSSKPLEWRTINEYDAEQNGGKPATWDKWKIDTDKALDAFQTALDVAGLVPGAGEVADCLNGLISLARGNYADAALSFAAMIPVIGGVATATKQAKKVAKAEGVYDLIVKNGDDVKGYVGQSENVFKRIADHFKPTKGKLKHTVKQGEPIIHKMPGSLPREREIYEQFVILKKYQGQINPEKNPLAKLLNKVNPVGGRFDLKTPKGRELFEKEALEVAKKYNLPTTFNLPTF